LRVEDGGSKVEVLQQSQSSQIHINQNNTKKLTKLGGGWRYNATKISGRKGTFCWVWKNGNIIYNLFFVPDLSHQTIQEWVEYHFLME